jgi:hypothetical protein
VIDEVIFGAISADMGYARVPNGTGPFAVQEPTFNLNNESSPTLFENSKKNDFALFPNPVANTIFIKNSDKQINTLVIYSIFGQEVITKKNTNKMDVSHLKSGLYFVKINNNQTIKFIKQ